MIQQLLRSFAGYIVNKPRELEETFFLKNGGSGWS